MKPYRGERYKKRHTLLLVLLSLILLMLAAVVVFFVAQEYIVFNADGFRFDLPRLLQPREEEPSAPVEEPSFNLVIDGPSAPPTGSPVAQPDPPPLPPAPTAPVEPIYSAAFYLSAPEFLATLAQPGGEYAVGYAVGVKEPDGIWQIPGDGATTPEQEALTAGVASLADNSIFSIAVATALRDDAGPRKNRAAALHTANGVIWLDYNYVTWYNPYAADTETYLNALVTACAQAGFREIMLRDLSFVTRGKVQMINFGPEDSPQSRMEQIARLAGSAADTLAQLDSRPKLSVLLTSTAAQKLSDPAGGQDVALLAQVCDILYVETDDPDFDLSALDAAVEGTACRIGLYLTGEGLPQSQRDFISAIPTT